MSNKNNNKENRLNENQRIKKKKMLLELQQEIKQLELEIKQQKSINFKNNTIKNLKISLRTAQLLAPYVLMVGITFGCAKSIGATPFYRDDEKQKLKVMKEIDSFGNIRQEQQYQDYINNNNTISHYSKWELSNEDGLYYRNITTYSATKLTEEKIMNIINDNNTSTLEDIFGEPSNTKIEYQNNLSEEEIKAEAFLQATLFSEIDNDFILVKQTIEDNILDTIYYFSITTVALSLTGMIRTKKSSFDYSRCISEIKEKCPTTNIKELSKKLEIKRSNYNRLAR